MSFYIELCQKEVDAICKSLLYSQENSANAIRFLNKVMRHTFGNTADHQGEKQDIEVFNEQQKLLRKLVERASDDFKKTLRPDDLKLWEELPLETRGLADSDEGGQEKSAEERTELPRYRRVGLAKRWVMTR